MKQLYPLITALLFCSNFLVAQPRHPIVWQKCFGGFFNEAANDAVIFADQTAVIVGTTNSTDGDVTGYHQNNNYTTDGWVVKIDTDGNIIWQKAVGGTGNDVLLFVKPGANNSSYCIGYSSSEDGDIPAIAGQNKLWIIKLDSSGNTMWSKIFDSLFIPSDATVLSDGSLAVIANAVIKINAQGDVLWKKTPAISFGDHLAEYDAGTIISSAGYSFSSADGSYTYHDWSFPNWANYGFKVIDTNVYFGYETLESTDYCNIFRQNLRKMTDTAGVYTDMTWHSDCVFKYGDWPTYPAHPNGLILLTDTSFATVGAKVAVLDYFSSAFFYQNGFFSVYGTNVQAFNSVKAYQGEHTFLCVGYTASYDDWDFQGNHNVGSSDIVIVKLAALTVGNWIGIKSPDWNDKDNWSNHEVPYMGTIVTIPAGTPNSPVVNNDAACYSIKLEPGATMKVNDGFNLQITGRKRVY